MIDTSWSRQAGISANSAVRSARLYQIWLETIGVSPWRSACMLALTTCQPAQLLTPT